MRSEGKMKARDRVDVIKNGKKIGEGTIINFNAYREPSMAYAIDVDGYTRDIVFCGEEELRCKKEND